MSASYSGPDLAGYRDCVTELVEAGEAFGDIEDAIDAVGELTEDQKAALWLFAFSMRDPQEQQRDARGPPRVRRLAETTAMTENVRDRELRHAIDAALNEMAGAAEYRRSQRAATNGKPRPTERAHPREFDESGFPIPQRQPSFVQRVARLLNPL